MKPEPSAKPEEIAIAELEEEIAELRRRLKAAREEEDKLEERLEPLRKRVAKRSLSEAPR